MIFGQEVSCQWWLTEQIIENIGQTWLGGRRVVSEAASDKLTS